tara:strand:- start:3958 stop:5463 length:1506 start_codon:yes stop_codon:yes gene_type:complete
MADWATFATSFLNDTAGYINERKDKAEVYADELREQADRNKGKLQKLRAAAGAQQGFIAQAKGLYASPEQIEAALDAGPTGLQSLVSELSKLKSDFRDGYDAELVSDYAKLPEGFKATGNIDPLARYGLKGQEVGDTVKPDGGWWQRAMGQDAMARTRYEADQQMTGSGMSVYDMAELDGVTGYDSMNASSFLSYVAPKRFNTSKKASAQEALGDVAITAKRTPAYEALEAKLAAVDGQYANPVEKAAATKVIVDEMGQYINDYVNLYVDSQVELYGESYVDAMGPLLDQMGISASLPEEGGTGLTSTATVTAPVNNEIIVTELPEIVSRTKIKGRDFTLLNVDGVMRLRDEVTKEVLSEEATEQARIQYEEGYSSLGSDTLEVLGKLPEFKSGRNKGRNGGRTNRVTEAEVNSAPEAVETDAATEASPRSEAMIQKFGKDILAYFRESGLTKDDDEEDFKAVLADWYGENSANKELVGMSTGADDGSIIYVMRMMLDGGS